MAISGGQQRLDWYAVPGVPLTIVLDTADGADWASAPIVHVGPIEADGDITPVIPAQTATITATASRATLTLTDAQMAAILTAYPVAARTACPWHVRLGTGEAELAVSTGHIIWDTTGRMVTASAQLVVGPAGLTAVSADAGNAASLGTDGLIYVAPGAGTVSSVNGQTGAVVLGAADVGADAAGTAAAAVAALDIPAAAYPVQQVTLSGNLAYSLPVDAPTDQVIGVVFSQDGTGGHTVTYGAGIDGTQAPIRTAAGEVTVVELYPIGGGQWRAFSDLIEGAPTSTQVTPLEPTFTDPSGTVDDRYVIPAQAGVVYRLGGTITAAGTYTPTAGQAVTITAEAASGYTLTPGATTTWSHTFSTAVVNTAPSMTLGAATVTGLSVSQPFTTSDVDGNTVTVTAAWGDGQSGTVTSPAQHTYSTAGTYAASFTPNDGTANGAVRSSSYTVAAALPPVGNPATLAEAIVTYGAAGYWKLSETSGTTITDYSGNGRHGTLQGVAGTDYTLGQTNGFAAFLTSTGKVVIPDNDAWTITAGGMTVFSIHRFTEDVSQQRLLVGKTDTNQEEWKIVRSSWEMKAIASNANGATVAYQTNSGNISPTTLTAWKGVAVNFPLPGGGEGPKFYLGNGTPVGTPAFNSGVYANRTSPVNIGTDFRGAIGHVAIFPLMLTDAHITKLMDLARAEGLIT